MNIFVFHNSPVICAYYLDDKRKYKMLIETAQIMSAAHHLCGGSKDVYKLTHYNHPVSVWCRKTTGNYKWTYRLFVALAAEFSVLSGREHLTWKKLGDVLDKVPPGIPEGERTPWENCTPYKMIDDVFYAYMVTLAEKWEKDNRRPYWGSSLEPPSGFKESLNQYTKENIIFGN